MSSFIDIFSAISGFWVVRNEDYYTSHPNSLMGRLFDRADHWKYNGFEQTSSNPLRKTPNGLVPVMNAIEFLCFRMKVDNAPMYHISEYIKETEKQLNGDNALTTFVFAAMAAIFENHTNPPIQWEKCYDRIGKAFSHVVNSYSISGIYVTRTFFNYKSHIEEQVIAPLILEDRLACDFVPQVVDELRMTQDQISLIASCTNTFNQDRITDILNRIPDKESRRRMCLLISQADSNYITIYDRLSMALCPSSRATTEFFNKQYTNILSLADDYNTFGGLKSENKDRHINRPEADKLPTPPIPDTTNSAEPKAEPATQANEPDPLPAEATTQPNEPSAMQVLIRQMKQSPKLKKIMPAFQKACEKGFFRWNSAEGKFDIEVHAGAFNTLWCFAYFIFKATGCNQMPTAELKKYFTGDERQFEKSAATYKRNAKKGTSAVFNRKKEAIDELFK